MGLAVGHEQIVDGAHERLLPGLVEADHELEALLLQPRVDEGALLLAGGDRLVHEVAHARVDLLEDLVEVGRELVDQLSTHDRVGDLRAVDALLHQRADAVAHEGLLALIEVTVDIAERRHHEDDGLHLALGYLGVAGEGEHGSPDYQIDYGSAVQSAGMHALGKQTGMFCVVVVLQHVAPLPHWPMLGVHAR